MVSMLTAFDLFSVKIERTDDGKQVSCYLKCSCCGQDYRFITSNASATEALLDAMARFQASVFYHVGLEWMLVTERHKHLKNIELEDSWFTSGPTYCKALCNKLHGKTFESFFLQSHIDRDQLMESCCRWKHDWNKLHLSDDSLAPKHDVSTHSFKYLS